MPEFIKINILEAPRFIMPDGSTCYGDSDCTTLYDPKTDTVYLCICPHCKSFVNPDDMNCPRCDKDLLKK